MLHLLRPQIRQLPWKREYAPTRISEFFKILEDDLGFRSLLRFLAPALFGDLPDRQGNSRSFEASWLLWSLPLRNQEEDVVVCIVRERHLPSRKLEGEMI